MRGCARLRKVLWLGALASLVAAAPPSFAAGFGIFEQGTKAMGMGMAFTAQADDGSAMFHNVGGLAFQKDSSIAAGLTIISLGDSEFEGAAPFPGPTARGEQADNYVTPAHIYYVKPLSQSWTFGFGFNDPYGLVTEWENPETFPGRFINTKAELTTYDLNPSIAWQATPNFGLGFGVIGRFAEVQLNRRAAAFNPFTNRQVDVAKVKLESDLDNGLGWNVGMLHKVTNSFSWGLSYRSKIEVDFGGDARLTQVSSGNAQFDALVAASRPFGRDLPIETSLEFPDMASFGVGFAFTPNTFLELDANWTGWSSFEKLEIFFTDNSLPTEESPQEWEDVYNYRAGFRWNSSPANQWRLGFIYDETPQPEAAASPLLPDANRNALTAGFGHTTGGGWTFDLAVMYLDFDEREVDESFEGELGFFGSYNTSAWLLGFTMSR